MNLNDFVVPQLGLYEWEQHIQSSRLEDTFSDDLKKLSESTTNVSNAPERIPTAQNLKEILMSDKVNEPNKKIFWIVDRKNISRMFFIGQK